MTTACPGCGRRIPLGGSACDHCHYFDLRDDPTRYHYCGSDSCHCRNLRGTMWREVLDSFADVHRSARA
jgi:hypothetical protein